MSDIPYTVTNKFRFGGGEDDAAEQNRKKTKSVVPRQHLADETPFFTSSGFVMSPASRDEVKLFQKMAECTNSTTVPDMVTSTAAGASFAGATMFLSGTGVTLGGSSTGAGKSSNSGWA